MNIKHQLDQAGQAWYKKAIEYIHTGDYVSLEKHMKQANKDYRIEHEILGCIGRLTESNVKIADVKVSPEIVSNIQLVSENPVSYKLETIIGNLTFLKLSDFFPLIKDDKIENHAARQGYCHEKAFEMAKKCIDNVQLVTSRVSVLSDINTYFHSWVESEIGAAFDYTFNVALGLDFYKELLHPVEPPLLRIDNSKIKNRQINFNQWAAMVNNLYDKF